MSDEMEGGEQPSQAPKYLTQDEVAGIVNSAVTSQLKRSMSKSIESALEAALKPIREKLEAAPTQAPPAQSQGSSESPEVLALKRQHAELLEKVEKAEQARVQAEQRARDDRAYQELRAIVGKSVRPELADMLAKNMFFADKVVEFDESGKPLMRVKRKSPIYGETEDALPLADGVAEFLKSDEAKVFLPAPQGSESQKLPRSNASATRGSLDDPNLTPQQHAAILEARLKELNGNR